MAYSNNERQTIWISSARCLNRLAGCLTEEILFRVRFDGNKLVQIGFFKRFAEFFVVQTGCSLNNVFRPCRSYKLIPEQGNDLCTSVYCTGGYVLCKVATKLSGFHSTFAVKSSAERVRVGLTSLTVHGHDRDIISGGDEGMGYVI